MLFKWKSRMTETCDSTFVTLPGQNGILDLRISNIGMIESGNQACCISDHSAPQFKQTTCTGAFCTHTT